MDPAKMKVVDLRSELGVLGLDTKGNKAALVERLKKALESKTGVSIPDTTILDTSSEDIDDPGTPHRAKPAPRTLRRSSSARLAAAAIKQSIQFERIISEESEKMAVPKVSSESEDSISQDMVTDTVKPDNSEELSDDQEESIKSEEPDVVQKPEIVQIPEIVQKPEIVQEPVTVQEPVAVQDLVKDKLRKSDEYCNENDNKRLSDKGSDKKDKEDSMETDEANNEEQAVDIKEEPSEDGDEGPRELTEEEEWDLFNDRLIVLEKERLEREKRQAEEDARQLEECRSDPVKLQRLMRKRERKSRWNNYYRNIEVTSEVLTPPSVEAVTAQQPQPLMTLNFSKAKNEITVAKKSEEPEIDESKVTLSWYDSDLNQYLTMPSLCSVTPLCDGVFSNAWAGARATHGVTSGKVCYEVRVGEVRASTEDVPNFGLRIGWSTANASLHLGEDEVGWGYENIGEVVNKGEYKEFGKKFSLKDVIGVYLDMDSDECKISYTLNGEELGVAFEFPKSQLEGEALFPHILTKNYCYEVNFGDDRYNMLTKTKTLRRKVEIPVEKVLEEKKEREDEIKRLQEEAKELERQHVAKIRKEREEQRLKKKREKAERDREKEAKRLLASEAETEDKEDGEKPSEDKPSEEKLSEEKQSEEKQSEEKLSEAKLSEEKLSEEKDSEEKQNEEMQSEDKQIEEKPKQDELMENGEGVEKEPAETKPPEAMETDQPQPEPEEVTEVKTEPMDESEVPEVTEEQILSGLTLDKRVKFVIRFVVEEVLDGEEAALLPGFSFLVHSDLQVGPLRPKTNGDCEVILMVGLPGSGKTFWARKHAAENPEKRYNILSTGLLFDKMKVKCKPFRSTYEGRWDVMVSKCAKCVLKLLEMAPGRRRNYILDQTNVYPSAQRRKLREFEGYRRIAVVVVPDEATYEERQKLREEADGKEVPDGAVLDMKANVSLPEKSPWLDEVIYAELAEEEAKQIVEKFHKEAKAAGAGKEKEKRERSASRDAHQNKRPKNDEWRSNFGGRDDRRPPRDFNRDRGDRWGGGGGGGGMGGHRGLGGGGLDRGGLDRGGLDRGGPDRGGGGNRWGNSRGGRDSGRDGGGGRWGGPPSRYDGPPRDRWGGGGRGGGNDHFGGGGGGGRDFNRDGGFRGNRGNGGGGPMGGGMGGMGGGPRNDRAPPSLMGPPGPDRGPQPPFERNNRSLDRRPPQMNNDKRNSQGGGSGGGSGGIGGPNQGSGGGSGAIGGSSGGGSGSWQRGGQIQQQQNRGNAPSSRANTQQPPATSNMSMQRNNSKNNSTAMSNNTSPNNQSNQNNQTANQNQQQNSWNQWGPWAQWSNWNQGQTGGWGGWNWGNWGGANQQGQNTSTTSNTSTGTSNNSSTKQSAANQQGGNQQPPAGQDMSQWPANYQQQWYQWQQWQQQQQRSWPGYGTTGNQSGGTTQDPQLWAQYYQNCGTANTGASSQTTEKK